MDVAVAVRLMELAQDPKVASLTLFAGDRDFFDAIQFVLKQGKRMNALGFRDNFSSRLELLLDSSNIAYLNDYWPTLCEIPGASNLLPADFDAKLKEA